MKKIEVQASRVSSAEPHEIYALLANSATYPLWSMIRYYELLRPGREGPNAVGAVRLFRTNRITVMREEITELVPNERVGYILLSGFPLLDYRSQATLEKAASGTRIHWKSSFYPKYPGTGWYWRRLMTWVLRRLVKSLEEAAEDPDRRLEMLMRAEGKMSLSRDSNLACYRSQQL